MNFLSSHFNFLFLKNKKKKKKKVVKKTHDLLNTEMLAKWRKSIEKHGSIKALREFLVAYRSGCEFESGTKDSGKKKSGFEITSSSSKKKKKFFFSFHFNCFF